MGFCQFIGIPGLIEPISDHTVLSKVGYQCNLLAADRGNPSGRLKFFGKISGVFKIKVFGNYNRIDQWQYVEFCVKYQN